MTTTNPDPTVPVTTDPAGTDPAAVPPPPPVTTTPAEPPPPPPPPLTPAEQLPILVTQIEADIDAFHTADKQAAASMAKAAVDDAAATTARSVAHADFVNLAAIAAQLDPGDPNMPAAIKAFHKFASMGAPRS